ncbi:sigma-54-dependent Fis family transcriptional regulator [bacterium]|nr:sigma-54-dependent Fis family transcriptional regulator [bacterium]
MRSNDYRVLIMDPAGALENLRDNPYPAEICVSPKECLTGIREGSYDMLYISLPMDSFPAEKLIKNVQKKQPLLVIILFTPDRAMVSDFLSNLVDEVVEYPYDHELTANTIRTLVAQKELLDKCDLVGRSDELKTLADLVIRIAPTGLPVLISGESGTGKELVALAVHNHSLRKDKPFLAVNSGAIPRGVLESELFGHEKGAFTGAIKQRKGYFEQANGGTIFLDEIGDLPMDIQVKLLRVIEEKEFLRVGGGERVKVDVRIIAASNKDLKVEMEQGRFREDLYFRLAGVKIYIPPLKDRPRDIPVLTYKFMKDFSKGNEAKFGGISGAALQRMMEYHWPGNVRELKNLIENALILAGSEVVLPQDIEPYFQEHSTVGRKFLAKRPDNGAPDNQNILEILVKIYQEVQKTQDMLQALKPDDNGKGNEVADRRRNQIIRMLEKNNWDKELTARELGISLRTLYRRFKKYDIRI